MNCHKVEELINAYIDDEIKDLDDSIKNHISQCPSCKAIYEDSLAVKAMLNGLDLLPLPDDFEETLHDKLVDSKVQPLYKNKLLKTFGYVATVAAVGVIAFMTGLNIEEPIDHYALDNDYGVAESANRTLGNQNSAMNDQADVDAEDDVESDEVEGFVIQEAPDMDESITNSDVNEESFGKMNESVYTVTVTFSEDLTGSDGIYHYKINHMDDFNIIDSILENYSVYNLERLTRTQLSFQINSDDIDKLTTELIEKTSIDFGVNLEFDSREKSELIKVIIELKEE